MIVNKTSEHFYRTIAPVIEEELQLPVWGFLPREQKLALESRHLGLKLPKEISGLQEQIRGAAEILEKSVSIDQVIEAAGQAGRLQAQKNTVKQKAGSG